MKKSLLTFLLGAFLILTACEKETVSTNSYNISTFNYVTHLNDDAEPIIKRGSYTFSFDNEEKKVSVATDMVDLGNDDDSSFITRQFAYKWTSFIYDGESNPVYAGACLDPGTDYNGLEIRNLRFELSQTYNLPDEDLVYTPDPNSPLPQPDLSLRLRPSTSDGKKGYAPRMVYTLGDKYMVYTFWPDLYYKGVTKSEVIGVDGEYVSQEVGYRLKFSIAKKTATVVLYNVKFHKDMPAQKCLILPDLDVQFTNNGYKVEATNVVPLYIEGTHLMESPRFPFTSFSFVAEGNMVEGSCDFTVAGRFHGSFVGEYMKTVIR